jgi:hypothetical protein
MGLLTEEWQSIRENYGTSSLYRARRRERLRERVARRLSPPRPSARGDIFGHRRDSRRLLRERGAAISAAIVSGDVDQAAEALEALAGHIGRGRASTVFRKLCAARGDLFDAVSVCDCCGSFSTESLTGIADGDSVCDTCLDESYCACSDCSDVVANDDATDIGGSMVCESCRDGGDYFHCGDCSEWFDSSDGSYELSNGRCVCSVCSESYYYWESDGLYHDQEEDDETVSYPNQGPSQADTPIWKWLTARVKQGVRDVELPNSNLSDSGFSQLWEAMFARKLLSWDYSGRVVYTEGDRLCDGGKAVRAGAFEQWARNEGWSGGSAGGGIPWSTKAGTLPKRIAKFFASCGLKLKPDSLGMIGDLARSYCPKSHKYRYDVVGNGSFDWSSGDFGDHGSCYWGCHSKCRYQLQSQHNAFAIRWYRTDEPDSKQGCGRCWVVVQKGIAFLFNYYGPDSLLTAARMLATESQSLYHECSLKCNGGTSDFYLNGSGRGYAVGYCSDSEFPAEHDFSFRGF